MKPFNQLTEKELLDLGFRRWDDNSDLMLVPASYYDQLPDGTEVTTIFGEVRVKGPDSDKPELDGKPNRSQKSREIWVRIGQQALILILIGD
jgi:hypothetical protein